MKRISVIQNLPTGGGREIYTSVINYLETKYLVNNIHNSVDSGEIQNIFEYYFYLFVILPIKNVKNKKKIYGSDVLIAFQDWISKSPLLMSSCKIPVVYICQEPPREFYDDEYINTFTLKDKIINKLLLIVVKHVDYWNIIRTKKIQIIANSRLSEKQIFKAYNIHSKIVYPGIKLKEFQKYKSIDNRENKVISVGAINKLKNQKFLIDCLSNVDKKNRPILILVGHGGDKKYIQQIQKMALEKDVKIELFLNIKKNN